MTGDVMVSEPGVYPGMSDAWHHSDPVVGAASLSATAARGLLDPGCPAQFRWDQDHPTPPTPAMEFGTVCHTVVFGTGQPVAVVNQPNWRCNAAREAGDQARKAGAVPVLGEDRERVDTMAAALRAHPVAGRLLNADGPVELSMFWVDRDTGVWRRGRVDKLATINNRTIIVDYKTCQTADPRAVAKSAADYGYHMQAAAYVDAVTTLGVDHNPLSLLIFQSVKPPHLVNVTQLDADALAVGKAFNRQAVALYAECSASGVWPGYDYITTTSLPRWAARPDELEF